jgi:hypothetical protein
MTQLILRTTAIATLVLTGADHWTTYVCLREPVMGWSVIEANPVVDLLFSTTGLMGGLAIDSLFTLAVVVFLFQTKALSRRAKQAFLSTIVLMTGYAVVNNIQAISALGISPLGIG